MWHGDKTDGDGAMRAMGSGRRAGRLELRLAAGAVWVTVVRRTKQSAAANDSQSRNFSLTNANPNDQCNM